MNPYPVGAKVVLRADPSIIGIVVREISSVGDPKLEVFCGDGRTRSLYASQLEIAVETASAELSTVDRLKAALTATQLARPSAKHLYSLGSSRIQFIPYQYRPVMKLIRSDRPRLLIADEVGVGKTIEAGLIIKELQARREIQSVLIICPKPLVTERKWLDEMKRFDESFIHLNGETLNHCINETYLDGTWPSRFSQAIVPFSLLDEKLMLGDTQGRRVTRGLLDLDEPPKFDLVIVDEAHHIRNTETWRHRNVKFFVENAEAVVFLTATPIQTREQDLFNLLHLLRPDVISDPHDFERIGAPNPALNAAATAARGAGVEWVDTVKTNLATALDTVWGHGVLAHDPRTHELRDLLEVLPTAETRVKIIRLLEDLHTFSGFITRTRRRDIGAFTTRKPRTIEVPFTSGQQQLHDQLLQLCGDIVEARHGTGPVAFLISGLRRQAASSINGLAPLLYDLVNRRLEAFDEYGENTDGANDLSPDVIDTFQPQLRHLLDLASALRDDDPKFDALERALVEKLEMPNPKAILFTSYLHTVGYLFDRLTASGLRVAQVHGGIDDEARRTVRRRFKLPSSDPDAIDVLLSTEVGTEGLDYQFCDMLINYDLPWNPMRIEQRIGRIDRYGQQSESVAILNFVTAGTVDAEIYHRCLWRIGVFEQALGASEAILGDITTGIRAIAGDLTLTLEEQRLRLQQLADNEINVIEEQLKLEDQQSELFGLEVPTDDGAEVRNATSPWMTADALCHLVVEYLTSIESGKRINLRPDRAATLRLSRSAKDRLLRQYEGLPKTLPSDREWTAWLKSEDSVARLTVTPELEGAHLLSPTHPLVRCATEEVQLNEPVMVSARVRSTKVPAGRYPVAIHGWSRLGIRDDYQLRLIAGSTVEPEMLAELLRDSDCVDGSAHMSDTELDQLEAAHYSAWRDSSAKHRERTAEWAESLIASLTTTSQANLLLLEDQLAGASEERIRRMRTSQIESARADYQRRLARLEGIRNRSDIQADLLATVLLEVVA
ncbi:helicase-related protein [Arthrobacter sp. 131MFCol6.1]|uniref:helicase-related protein n=1 Tax=Arthrobacter sp. 131MFCol6.1 TaxID=1157944 RepID=UPI000367B0F8|nr:SNF2-related protein [Arthrobacter sp. 131MFCol6.1]